MKQSKVSHFEKKTKHFFIPFFKKNTSWKVERNSMNFTHPCHCHFSLVMNVSTSQICIWKMSTRFTSVPSISSFEKPQLSRCQLALVWPPFLLRCCYKLILWCQYNHSINHQSNTTHLPFGNANAWHESIKWISKGKKPFAINLDRIMCTYTVAVAAGKYDFSEQSKLKLNFNLRFCIVFLFTTNWIQTNRFPRKHFTILPNFCSSLPDAFP